MWLRQGVMTLSIYLPDKIEQTIFRQDLKVQKIMRLLPIQVLLVANPTNCSGLRFTYVSWSFQQMHYLVVVKVNNFLDEKAFIEKKSKEWSRTLFLIFDQIKTNLPSFFCQCHMFLGKKWERLLENIKWNAGTVICFCNIIISLIVL